MEAYSAGALRLHFKGTAVGLKYATAGVEIPGPSHLVVRGRGVRVVDLDDHVIRGTAHLVCRDGDGACAIALAMDGVAQQRQQHLFDLTAVDVDQLQARGALKGDFVRLT